MNRSHLSHLLPLSVQSLALLKSWHESSFLQSILVTSTKSLVTHGCCSIRSLVICFISGSFNNFLPHWSISFNLLKSHEILSSTKTWSSPFEKSDFLDVKQSDLSVILKQSIYTYPFINSYKTTIPHYLVQLNLNGKFKLLK